MKFSHSFFVALMCILCLACSVRSFAQSQTFNLDSFRVSAQKLSTDSEKIKFIIERVITLGCEDSTSKLALANEARQMALKSGWNKGVYSSNRALVDVNIKCLKNYPRVTEIYQESVALAQKSGDVLNEAIAYEDLAKNYVRMNQHDKAIEYFGKGLLVNPPVDIKVGILAELGFTFGYIGDFPNAITYYDSCRKLIEASVIQRRASDIGDTAVLLGILLNMADIYVSMSNGTKALDNYEKVFAMGKKIENKRFVILSLTGMGKTYRQQKAFAKAIGYYNSALRESEAINRFDDEVMVLNEIANTYLDSGDFNKAKTYAEQALSLADAQQFQNLLSRSNTTLGKVYINLNKPDVAISYLQKALDYSLQNHKLEDQKEAWSGLSLAYKQSGRFDKALDAFQNFITIRDSTRNIEKTNEAIRKDLDNNYKREKFLAEAEYTKKIERVRLFTYGGYGGLALVVLLAFFIYRNYKTQKMYNALLSKEKKSHLAHIEAQSHVLSDIAHIQAHEVRGPVSAILGFVQIFNYDDPTDPGNKQVMEWIGVTAEKLDTVVRNVVSKENDLRSEHDNQGHNS